MASSEKKNNEKRYFRIAVPEHDEVVIKWLKMQDSPSFSVRQLIKDYVGDTGDLDDYFASSYADRGEGLSEKSKKRRGRPRKEDQAAASRNNEPTKVFSDASDNDYPNRRQNDEPDLYSDEFDDTNDMSMDGDSDDIDADSMGMLSDIM